MSLSFAAYWYQLFRSSPPPILCVRFSWRAQPTARTGSFSLRWDRGSRMTKTEVPHFTVRGLSPEPFQALFDLSDDELEKRRAKRYVADSTPGFPCRVSLQDAEPGEEVILTNFVHLDS